MLIDENEIKQMGTKLNDLKKTKGPNVAGTDKKEHFDSLIQQAEYHHWQLSQAHICGSLLDNYYSCRNEAKKSVNKRLWLIYFGFFATYLIALFCFGRFILHKNADFTKSLEMLGAFSVVALVIAGVHFFVNYWIFDHIDASGIKDLALAFFGFMVFYLIVFIVTTNKIIEKSPKSDSLTDMLKLIIILAGVASALHVWINHSIVSSLHKKDEETYQKLKSLEDEIRLVSETVDTHRPLKESIPIWKASVYHCINELKKL